MKTIVSSLVFFLILNVSKGQDILLGLKLSAGATVTHLKDNDHRPSGGLDHDGYLRNPADGSTNLINNHNGLSVGVNLDLGVFENFYFSTGLWFTNKGFSIGNKDGSYFGISSYKTTYIQFPLAGKIYFREVAKGLDLYAKLGVTLDLKAKEALEGGDGAHYWNLAKNYTHLDGTRGKNGDHKYMALFNPLNIGVLGSFGAEFKLDEQLLLFGSVSYNAGLLNIINPSLKHDDFNRTKVGEGLKIRTDFLSVDLGVIFPLK